jgi:hypothetical protein
MRKLDEDEIGLLNQENISIFFLVLAALAITTWWTLEHNYVSELAVERWSRIISSFAGDKFRLEDLRLLYPHLTNLLLLLFYYIPSDIKLISPYVVSCLFASVLLALWNHHLREKHYDLRSRVALIFLVAIHPYFIWGVAGGLLGGLSLLMFYFMYLASVRLIKEADARSFIMLGGVMGVYFFVDELTVFIYVAFLPLLPLVAPREMLRASPSSVYLIVSMPLLLSILAWIAYLTFVLDEGAWHYMNSPGESFRGAWYKLGENDWLRDFGGTFFKSLLATVILGALSFPVVAWLVWRARRHLKLLRDIEALPIHLALSAALATVTYFLAHPINLLYLTTAGVMAAVVLLPRETDWNRRGLYLMLVASAVGGWVTFAWKPNVEMQRWTQAIQGRMLPEYFADDAALGHWLDKNRLPTLVDEHAAFRALVARGDSEGLFLSFTEGYKKMLQKDVPTIEQVVIRDPRHNYRERNEHGSEIFAERLPDGVSQRYPNMYDHGMKGYNLVYDRDHWRVYRRNEASPLGGDDENISLKNIEFQSGK